MNPASGTKWARRRRGFPGAGNGHCLRSGIAPKSLPALENGLFMEAFRAKEPMADLIATIPVSVILNPDSGLLGAAVHALEMSATP